VVATLPDGPAGDDGRRERADGEDADGCAREDAHEGPPPTKVVTIRVARRRIL
jgi:hypothetical protein